MKQLKNDKSTILSLLIILTLGFLLRLYKIGSDNFWLDEVLSINFASKDNIFEIMKGSLSDNHPPFYYILLHYWTLFWGRSEFSVRFLSLVCGEISIILIYLFTKEIASKRIALISALLLAISPFHIWYSQEGRMFSLHMMLSILSNIFFLHFIHSSFSPSQGGKVKVSVYVYLGFIISSLLNMYTFVYSAFILLFQNIFIIFSRRTNKNLIKKWFVSQLIILAFYIPNPFFRLYDRFLHSGTEFEILDIRHPVKAVSKTEPIVVPYTFFTFSVGFSLGPSIRELHSPDGMNILNDYIKPIIFISLVFLYLFVNGIHELKIHRENFYFFGLHIVIPLFMSIIFSKVLGIKFNVRYVSAILPAYLIILSIGLNKVKKNCFFAPL